MAQVRMESRKYGSRTQWLGKDAEKGFILNWAFTRKALVQWVEGAGLVQVGKNLWASKN